MDKLSYSLTVSKNGVKLVTLTVNTDNKVVNVLDHKNFKDVNLGRITSAVVLKQFDDLAIITATGVLVGI